MTPGPGLLERAKQRYGRFGAAAYTAVLALVVLSLTGAVGLVSQLPWLFPSLGPTVMLFFDSPEHPSARPLNTIVGHTVGILAGIGCLAAFGLIGTPPAPVGGLTMAYVGAAAASVALTAVVLTLLGLPHPPAGASTLIVSLGILTTPPELLSMFAAVVLVTITGWGLNALLGTRPTTGESETGS